MKKFILLLGLIAILGSCRRPNSPREGDLLFCIADSSAFSRSIVESTRSLSLSHTLSLSELQFDHVGIFTFLDGEPAVLEASPRKGVSLTPLAEFYANSPAGLICLRPCGECDIPASLQRAMGHLGEKYDWHFKKDNGMMYCSELVYESYVRKDGSPLFEEVPMSFRDSSGQIPQFWTELFEGFGEAVPEGEPGTNPNGLADSENLVLIDINSYIAELFTNR